MRAETPPGPVVEDGGQPPRLAPSDTGTPSHRLPHVSLLSVTPHTVRHGWTYQKPWLLLTFHPTEPLNNLFHICKHHRHDAVKKRQPHLPATQPGQTPGRGSNMETYT